MQRPPAVRQRKTRRARVGSLGTSILAVALLVSSCARHGPPAPEVAATGADPAAVLSSSFPSNEDDSAASATWTVEVSDGATLRVNYRGTQIMSFHYLFWGKNFSWANPVVKNVRGK